MDIFVLMTHVCDKQKRKYPLVKVSRYAQQRSLQINAIQSTIVS